MIIIKKFKKFVKNRVERIYCHINPVDYARSIGVTIGGGDSFLWNLAKNVFNRTMDN